MFAINGKFYLIPLAYGYTAVFNDEKEARGMAMKNANTGFDTNLVTIEVEKIVPNGGESFF